MRPILSIALAGVTCLLSALPAAAQQYPVKPITIVVPNAAGSVTDTSARVIAEKLSHRLGEPVLIENRPGADTRIAAEYVAGAKPDGYTLLMTTNTSHSANPSLFKELRYDPVEDFTPIIRTGRVPFVLLVHPALPAETFSDFIAYAKDHPGEIAYASPVSSSLITSETIRNRAEIDIVRIPYTSSPQALTDLIGGQLQMFVADITTARPAIEGGKARALAVTTADRSQILPDIPSIAETLPDVEVISWAGLFGPAGLPDGVVDRLATDIHEILSEEGVRDQLETIGYEVFLSESPRDFGVFVADQIEHWALLVKEAGIEAQ